MDAKTFTVTDASTEMELPTGHPWIEVAGCDPGVGWWINPSGGPVSVAGPGCVHLYGVMPFPFRFPDGGKVYGITDEASAEQRVNAYVFTRSDLPGEEEE